MQFDPITYNEVATLRQDAAASLRTALRHMRPVFASGTVTAPFGGIVIMRAMGAGGGGARGNNATGGYAGAWGCKTVRVKKGDSLVVTIGAGGAGKAASDGDGSAGGDTTITVGGTTYTAPGGPGGKSGAASMVPNGPSLPATWDFGAASVRPGWASGSVITGGAGVDILAQGNNATTSANSTGSGGGGTGSPSAGIDGGGAMPGGRSALGQPAANTNYAPDAQDSMWGISYYGGGGGANGPGGNGGGGGGTGGVGGNGGGGSPAHAGGLGGGGGGNNSTTAGAGGNGYAFLDFYADLLV